MSGYGRDDYNQQQGGGYGGNQQDGYGGGGQGGEYGGMRLRSLYHERS